MSTSAVSAASEKASRTPAASAPLTMQVVSGSAFVLGGQLAVLAASLLATPFTIRLLGTERYGLLALVNLLINYLCYTDLGMNSASTRLAGEKHTNGHEAGEVETVWTALGSAGMTGTIFTVLTIWMAPALVSGLKMSSAIAAEAVPAIRIAALVFLGRSLSTVMNTPQLVRLRMKSVTVINSSVAIAQVLCAPIIIWFTGSLVHVMWAIAAITAAGLLAHCIIGRGLVKALSKPTFSKATLVALWSFGLAVTFALVADVILTNFERLMLAAFGSLAVLAHYSVAYTLASLVIMLPTAIGQTLFPAFSRLQQSPAELLKLYSRAMEGTLLVITPITVLVVVAAKPVLSLWAGAEFGLNSYMPCVILAAGIWFQSVAYVAYNLLVAGGHSKTVAKVRWMEVIPFLLLAAFLIDKYGAVGAAIAWSVRVVIDVTLLLIITRRTYGFQGVPLSGISATCIAALLLGAVGTAAMPLGPRLITIAMALAIYGGLVWSYALRPQDRAAFAVMLKVAP